MVKIDGDYYVYHKSNPGNLDHKEKLWVVVKNMKKNRHGFKGTQIKKGMTIKFGRI